MENDQKTGIVDSIAQAATLTGLSKSLLRWAKKSGCPAFRTGSRVDLGELHRWLADNRDKLTENTTDKEAVSVRLLLLKCDEQELINAKLRGSMYSASEVAARVGALGFELKTTLQAQLVDKLPAINAGLDVSKQRENNRRVFTEICQRFQHWAKEYDAASSLAA